ncbi:AraC family transcriptional regulator [Malaciobacter halophilus]|uniref:AraC family transcriptional regulator n=1 Tax=Malaciobacter halophilus TaxID=197482 RepID=A0A2N1J1Q5_9BACT|nr:AraC family transcriptional regulator [Malaciobacter halophilus]AXH10815.1 transcriptional regulator, AraC family [Malaciobacter halophilus]PKI80499.1 AraC family transcriptional regulator [Malaciobacter halophilus]
MKEKIKNLQEDLLKFINNKYCISNINGEVKTQIPNLDFYFSNEKTQFNTIIYEPSICIILQGEKIVDFGNEVYQYNSNEYLISSTHIPAKVKIKKTPYISFRIKFELEEIYNVIKNINQEKLIFKEKSEKGLFFNNIDEKLFEPICRLIKLLNRQEDEIKYLYPLIIKEILFILIKDESGYFLNKFAMEGTVSNKIVKTISDIKDNFNKKLNVKQLARNIDMSESSLYQNFKTITSMSPIQFQKKIRLEEAKLMLLNQNITACEVAFIVGYESPSQFSREYSKMFGMAPKAHISYLKSLNKKI